MRKLLSTGMIAAALLGGMIVAFGQAGLNMLTSLTGAETIDVGTTNATGGPSPYRNAVTANTLRNTTGYQISAATSGTIVTTVGTDNLLLTGAVGTATVDVPPSPPDGQLFSINNVSGSNFSGTITVAATDGSSFVPSSPTISNLSANSSQEWQYAKSITTWYRIR